MPQPPRKAERDVSDFILDQCNSFLKTHYAAQSAPVRTVLDAGGGSFSHFHIPPDARLLALDISFGQLVRNTATLYRVQADLHDLPFGGGALDMVICFNAIEHLNAPQNALRQIVAALRPGGILLLGCPDRASLKGWITRLTPIWFHRLYYRFVVGKEDRGEKHFDAFETELDAIVSSRALPKWLQDHGMAILFYRAYDGAAAYELTRGDLKRRLISVPYYTAGFLGKLLSGGRWRATDSDLLFVVVKSGEAPVRCS